MPKDKKPRRRSKPAAPQIEPSKPESQAVVIRSRPSTDAVPLVARLATIVRTVAVALIDVADAAAEALSRPMDVSEQSKR